MKRAHPRWWVLVAQGFLGVIVGVMAFVAPVLFASALVWIVAFWAVVTGILEIVAAVRLRHEMKNEWALGISGGFSLLLGVLLAIFPGAGLVVASWFIAAYALISGVSLIVLALRLRSHSTLIVR